MVLGSTRDGSLHALMKEELLLFLKMESVPIFPAHLIYLSNSPRGEKGKEIPLLVSLLSSSLFALLS